MRNVILTFISLFIVLSSYSFSMVKFIQVFLPNGIEITAEIALTDAERQRGLMFREQLDKDQGMLFVFENEGYHSFWMKNMKISIDILWLDKEKRIVHIERSVPPCQDEPCPSYTPAIPAKYVLELKAGSAEENKLRLYERIEFVLEAGKKNLKGLPLQTS